MVQVCNGATVIAVSAAAGCSTHRLLDSWTFVGELQLTKARPLFVLCIHKHITHSPFGSAYLPFKGKLVASTFSCLKCTESTRMPPRKKKHTEVKVDDRNGDQSADTQNSNEGAAEAPGRGTPRVAKRAAGDQTDAVPAQQDERQQSKQRRTARRLQAGASGTTSAQADAAMYDADAGAMLPSSSRPPLVPRAKPLEPKSQKQSADSDSIMEAVVKVFCIHCEPNFSLPWQRKRQYSSSSSGFILPGRRILTNAHCVDNYLQVKVKRRGSDTKYVASVLAVGTECDIAMLSVEDEEFWKGVEPVTFGSLPQLQDAVTVVGYPIGGDTMSVTSGVVSRIEVTSYVHGAAELLGIQIDAAINSGNSGGPAFNEAGECVGIAFQSLKHEDAENIGYIIPTPVIQHFITDYEKNGSYTGFPCLGVEWQKLENPDLRHAMKMKPGMKGVMIRRLEPTSPAFQQLKQRDILLSFDGTDIANDGTVPFRSGERISFSYLVSQKYTQEEARLRVLSGGKIKEVTVKMLAPMRLIPFHTKGLPPSYFIIAGLVFTPVTVPYLKSEYGKEYDFEAPVKLLDKMIHGMAEREGQQVVVLAQVLANEANIGYEDIINTQVLALNGRPIHDLKELVEAVDSCSDQYLNFDLDYHQKLVLNTAKAKQASSEILAQHCIPRDRSNDLLPPGAAGATPGLPPAEDSPN